MEVERILSDLGMSNGEIKVYLALLKLGSVQVSKIKEKTRLHRTTIYDFLEKLLNKGLVNYVVRNNVKHYSATDPRKLLDLIKEKESQINNILPDLMHLSEIKEDEIKVEVYKGVEGIKTILNQILRNGKDYVIFGIDESMFKEKLGHFMDQYFLQQKKIGFKERILTSEKVKYIYEYDTAIYRYLPQESFNPTPTYVWGDNVAILIWEPLSVIKIQHSALADSYAKYFEILWKIAKKKSKSHILKNKK